jgi:hypothetical protein
MRDAQIIQMHQRQGRREGLILAQLEYLKTRQEAMERVEQVTPWYMRVWFAFFPRRRWQTIEAVQDALLDQSRAELSEAAAKAKVAVPTEQLAQAVAGKIVGPRG